MENVRENIREMASKAGHEEGKVARQIEEHTSRLPSDLFLWGAGCSVLAALALRQFGRKDDAQFVGQWAPTLLVLGLYNKIVKELGHEGEGR